MKIRRTVNDAGQPAVEIEPSQLISVHVLWPAGVPPAPYPHPVYGAFTAVPYRTGGTTLLDGQGRDAYSALLMLGEEGGWRDDDLVGFDRSVRRG